MSKSKYIFRLQNDASIPHDLSNSLKHWDKSRMYDDKQIEAIKSTAIKATHQPTSVPSPFARIALVKTAFAEVARNGENALFSYQSIVSHTLDVAEIFFNYDKWSEDIEIVSWNYGKDFITGKINDESDLKKLSKHTHMYDTLLTFLEGDAETYNFDKMHGIHILRHKSTGKYIGATSPSTMFFSSANENSDLKINLDAKRVAFKDVIPLSGRSWEFQKYLFAWVEVNDEKIIDKGAPTFIFKELRNYLKGEKVKIGKLKEFDILKKWDEKDFKNNYRKIPGVEILGKPLYKVKDAGIVNVDDIFERRILRLEAKMTNSNFLILDDENKEAVLIPIKDKFFESNEIDTLKEKLEVNIKGEVVRYNLTLEGSDFVKKYDPHEIAYSDIRFDCALFPNIKFNNESEAYYRFGLVCDYANQDSFKLSFKKVDEGKVITINSKHIKITKRNLHEDANDILINHSIEKSNFDYIRIEYTNKNNEIFNSIIIPNFEKEGGPNSFEFAIDLGTTNTHIEYRVNNTGNGKPFDITDKEKQIHYLHGNDEIIRGVFDEEYIPQTTDDKFKLPMRTALSFGEGVNWSNVYPFEEASLNELYEKKVDFPYNKTITNLKWSNDEEYQNQIRVYIDSIMYLLRNKVILNRGNLGNTKIAWTYPVSMEKSRFEKLQSAWNQSYQTYFNGHLSNITPITESIAPFEHYIADGKTVDLISIDIGGGTTDIVISKDGAAQYITSFKFAANSIFGDGYSKAGAKNGIVDQFFHEISDQLNKSDVSTNVLGMFNEMRNERSSEDIASFLFSLKNNIDLINQGEKLASNQNLESKLLNNETYQIVFILFYAAIIYHLAQILKIKKLELPDKIVFSGNGSRLLQYISQDSKLIEDYTKFIFEEVTDRKYPKHGLDITLNTKNPKEATCKGAIIANENYSFDDIKKKIIVRHGCKVNNVYGEGSDQSDNNFSKFRDIDETYILNTEKEVEEFMNFVFDNINFFEMKAVDIHRESVDLAKKIFREKLSILTKVGFNNNKTEETKDDIINDSPFFYPLIGLFNEMTTKIYNDLNK